MADLAALEASPLFKGMNEKEIAELGSIFTDKAMQEGMMVFVENMPGEALYLIQRGAVKISKMLAEGDEKILVILGPDDIFGEMAIFQDSALRAANARVAEDARLLALRKSDFENLCERNPRIALKLTLNIVRVLGRRLHENEEEYRQMLLWTLGSQS